MGIEDSHQNDPIDTLLIHAVGGIYRVKERREIIRKLFLTLEPASHVRLLRWFREGYVFKEYDQEQQTIITLNRQQEKARVVDIPTQTITEFDWTPPPRREEKLLL